MRPGPAGADEWDALVTASGRPHLLQSAGWAQLKSATGWRARRYLLGDGGLAQVLLRPLALGLVAAYAPRGPLVEGPALPAAILSLREALRAERCAILLCDPEVEDAPALRDELARAGIRGARVHVQPRRTLLLDLSREPDALLAAMRKKTRQYIRKAERAGVVTEETTDVERFHAVLRRVAARDRFGIHEPSYFTRLKAAFGERAHFQMARLGQVDAGALLVVRFADRAWELFGGWSGAHAQERPFYLLKWRSLLRMRALGVRRYDMWGLAEEAELSGVESFKLGFGGLTVAWVGALEAPVRPWLYPLWRIAGRRRLARSGA